jgi:hypothetical protein
MVIELLYHGALAVIFGLLLLFFIIQSVRRKRSATALILSLILGVVAAIVGLLNNILALSPQMHAFSLSLQVALYTWQFYCWYLHLDRIVTLRIHHIRFGLVLFFVLLTLISVLLLVVFYNHDEIRRYLWLLADIGYDGLALFVFGYFGASVTWKSLRFNREKRNILFLCAYLTIALGFAIIFLEDLNDFILIDNLSGIIDITGDVGHALPLIGLMFIFIIYLTDFDYIYRLPFDVHVVLVAYKQSGNLISAIRMKTQKELQFEVHLVSGMLLAMNGIFGEIFSSSRNIQEISGLNAQLLFEGGQEILAIVVTDNSSYYLRESLKSYVKAFEKHFAAAIHAREPNLKKFQTADQLVLEYFPYCNVNTKE